MDENIKRISEWLSSQSSRRGFLRQWGRWRSLPLPSLLVKVSSLKQQRPHPHAAQVVVLVLALAIAVLVGPL